MNTVKVRNMVLGEGAPKICVPIVAQTKEGILDEARKITSLPVDVVEWRIDWFDDVFDFAKLEDVLKDLRAALGDIPLLMTFRTSKEGGEKAIEDEVYADINIKAAQTGYVDLVDVEVFTGDEIVKKIIEIVQRDADAEVSEDLITHVEDRKGHDRRCRFFDCGHFLSPPVYIRLNGQFSQCPSQPTWQPLLPILLGLLFFSAGLLELFADLVCSGGHQAGENAVHDCVHNIIGRVIRDYKQADNAQHAAKARADAWNPLIVKPIPRFAEQADRERDDGD